MYGKNLTPCFRTWKFFFFSKINDLLQQNYWKKGNEVYLVGFNCENIIKNSVNFDRVKESRMIKNDRFIK